MYFICEIDVSYAPISNVLQHFRLFKVRVVTSLITIQTPSFALTWIAPRTCLHWNQTFQHPRSHRSIMTERKDKCKFTEFFQKSSHCPWPAELESRFNQVFCLVERSDEADWKRKSNPARSALMRSFAYPLDGSAPVFSHALKKFPYKQTTWSFEAK